MVNMALLFVQEPAALYVTGPPGAVAATLKTVPNAAEAGAGWVTVIVCGDNAGGFTPIRQLVCPTLLSLSRIVIVYGKLVGNMLGSTFVTPEMLPFAAIVRADGNPSATNA